MALSGAKQVFTFATAGGAPVDISAALIGLDGVDVSEAEETTDIGGGGGRRGAQISGYVDNTADFVVDENATTRPLFWGKNGQTGSAVLSRDGTAAGGQRWSWSGPFTVGHSFGARNKRRFTISQEISGAITKDTH